MCVRFTFFPKDLGKKPLKNIGCYLKKRLGRGTMLKPTKDIIIGCRAGADFTGLWGIWGTPTNSLLWQHSNWICDPLRQLTFQLYGYVSFRKMWRFVPWSWIMWILARPCMIYSHFVRWLLRQRIVTLQLTYGISLRCHICTYRITLKLYK